MIGKKVQFTTTEGKEGYSVREREGVILDKVFVANSDGECSITQYLIKEDLSCKVFPVYPVFIKMIIE
jgi:hypothetical protein